LIEALTSHKVTNGKKLYQTVYLPSCHMKITELLIAKPINLKGRPGTIVEITQGSILVDFEMGIDL
jgi:hypothetical protein